MIRALRGAAVVCAITLLAAGSASALDLHRYWDDRCAECHGHSATFARQRLSVVDGKLTGKSHRTGLDAFLANHHTNAELAPQLMAMLAAQATTAPVYAAKCAGCHETAAQLARESLSLKGEEVVLKTSGRPVADLLKRHGKLTPAEAATMVETLKRIVREVGG
jgi:hypothetical protein